MGTSYILVSLVPILFFILDQIYRFHQKRKFEPVIDLVPLLVGLVVANLVTYLFYDASMSDTEIRNGRVVSKRIEKVSCSHSFPCNCDSKGHCSTCYEHANDYNYVVATSIPNEFHIDRIDNQGKKVPPRYEQVKAGDPVSMQFTYDNYIKAAKNSLFNESELKYDISEVPAYPEHVFDYHYVNRVNGIGATPEMNMKLQNLLADLGPKYQINAVIMLTNEGQDFVDALKTKWLGGKKNDVIMVFRVDAAHLIENVWVVSWTDQSLFKEELRDSLHDMVKFDIDKTLAAFELQVKKNWYRKRMADFEYIKDQLDLTINEYIITIVATLLLMGIIKFFMLHPYKKIGRNRRFLNRRF